LYLFFGTPVKFTTERMGHIRTERMGHILRLGAGGQLELEAVCATPLLVNGEALREGECRSLCEGDLVAVVAGGLELRVSEGVMDGLGGEKESSRGGGTRELRMDVGGLRGATQSSSVCGTVDDAMKCSICFATVFPAVLRTPCSLAPPPMP